MIRIKWNKKTITSLLCVTILGFVFAEALLNLTPPISRDALIHHLAIPKLWLAHGGICDIPWVRFSYYPANIDMLYLVCLWLESHIAAKFVHLAFGIGTAFLVYLYLKKKFGTNWGLIGGLIFFSTPVIVRLSTTVYVDLGMAFFTTGSILAFFRWREGEYRDTKWLVLSAISMGLAVGSKYNALIAWFFLNLALVFCYSRDRRSGLSALKYGALFFLIALSIASPWFIRNYALTGNPIYPLHDGFVQALHHSGEGKSAIAGIVGKSSTASRNVFQKRNLVYGESFLQTILIPVRIFFQGKDGSPRYFDGVLNPLLIIMPIFAFLNKEYVRDKVFLALFSGFFFLVAYFSEAIRIRYILPIIPCITILTVTGIRSIALSAGEKPGLRYIGLIVFAVTAIAIAFNLIYLKDYFGSIQPLKYVLNQETRDEFLTRHLGSYPAMQYINNNLPDNASCFLMFLGGRGYYLNRAYRHESSSGMNTLSKMVNSSKSTAELREFLGGMGTTHILMRTDLVAKYLHNKFSEEEIRCFMNLVSESCKQVYKDKRYAVWDIQGFSNTARLEKGGWLRSFLLRTWKQQNGLGELCTCIKQSRWLSLPIMNMNS